MIRLLNTHLRCNITKTGTKYTGYKILRSNYSSIPEGPSKLNIAVPLAAGGMALYLFSIGIFYNRKEDVENKPTTEIKQLETISTGQLLKEQQDKSKVYDEIANKYDEQIKWDEFVMGLYLLRRYVIKRNAEGNVLELSAGTGRNMKYYHDTLASKYKIESLTLLDQSKNMLQLAQDNENSQTLIKEFIKEKKRMRFYQGDSQNLTQFKDEEFDTIIDTFGLCSYSDPVKALKEMKRVCNKEGKIVLLQHGIGKLSFLNNLLHNNSEKHAEKWGCWWNRDILEICKMADLNIQSISRWHFGTTYYIVAKP